MDGRKKNYQINERIYKQTNKQRIKIEEKNGWQVIMNEKEKKFWKIFPMRYDHHVREVNDEDEYSINLCVCVCMFIWVQDTPMFFF